jgi:hypothetical protein
MMPGSYGGAAFDEPLALTLGGGRMATGLWEDYALPTYAGIGVYRQDVVLSDADVRGGLVLNLGKVLVAAEVLVNGQPVGVRLAAPFTFDLGDAVQVGENTLEVRVANTLAPHYETIPSLAQGPTASGLIGPVTLTSFGE